MVPALWVMVYAVTVVLGNFLICRVTLNGSRQILRSKVPVPESLEHSLEHWVFINGIAVGHHWLQNNLDRLAYTFGRSVTGVHNPTNGIIFDTIACLIQRCFNYATQDIRTAYPLVKQALLNPQHRKVVLILHSQGGIEGGMIIDWLLDELPQDTLRRLEVYTFANAANHFNNPNRTVVQVLQDMSSQRPVPCEDPSTRCVPYIEHYANSVDFVSLWGVLNFAHIPNRYMGRLFVRSGSGHLLNQHYLDPMFTLGPDGRVLDANPFMDSVLDHNQKVTIDDRKHADVCLVGNVGTSTDSPPEAVDRVLRVKDLSRLWKYRNGGSPQNALVGFGRHEVKV